MKYIADKTLLVASEVNNKHLKEIDAKTKKSIEGYFNKCNIYVNHFILDAYKMLDISTTANEFTMSVYNGHLHINDASVGITIENTDKFFFSTKISKHNLRRLALLMNQLHTYTERVYVSPNHTMLKVVSNRGTILVALKN